MGEEERRRAAERERHNSYKDFQGKVEKETGKVCVKSTYIQHAPREQNWGIYRVVVLGRFFSFFFLVISYN